jgi:hypothetical protein
MKKYIRNILWLICGIAIGLAITRIKLPENLPFVKPLSNLDTNLPVEVSSNTNKVDNDDAEFPPFNLPLEYFDTKEIVSISAHGQYGVIRDVEAYQSYPTTTISLGTNLYSNVPTSLPPIKSDIEIHGNDPMGDFYGDAKNSDIQKYGDLARRFVGVVGEGWSIDSANYSDVDKDGKKETLLSLSLTGANIIGQRDVVIKGDKVIFSTDQTTFSTLTPAKNGNGFFLQWADNFKKRDGYVTTRFIFDGNKFVPVYEQKTRYIRIKQ